MNAHLLVPDLFWPAAAGGEPYRGLALPALETMLGRGRHVRTAGTSLERWLAAAFALPPQLPLAPYALLADGGEPGEHWWMQADPAHLKVHRDRLILADATRLGITSDEAADLVAALNAQLAPDGIALIAPTPGRWYARLAGEPRVLTTPTAEVIGRNVETFMPAGDEGSRWRRIANEAQMLLHAHARNEARENGGALTINSVWFWGAGRVGKPVTPYDDVASNHPLARGLALASRSAASPLPASAESLLKAPGGITPLIVAELNAASAYGDVAGWRDAVTGLERSWWAPIVAGIHDGALESITLHGLGPDFGCTATLDRKDLRRFWRRKRPLLDFAGFGLKPG
jgi:hypothetical protein